MKKALVYTSVASMIQQFNMENIRLLQEAGFRVDVACNLESGSTIPAEAIAAMKQELEAAGVGVIHIPLPRRIASIGDILRSFFRTRRLIQTQGYALIHCHSPIGGILCRLANRFSGRYGQAKMIYTAHGFHFFRGAPRRNWLIFYPLERLCSRYTDVLITINREDFAFAKAKLKAKRVCHVPGIGVDIEKFRTSDSAEARRALGLQPEETVLLSVGELSVRKNHALVLRALARLEPGAYRYLLCGIGPLEPQLRQLVRELKLEDRVCFLGYRSDIPRILAASDVFLFPSLQEGLPVALMEAMAAGKPVACSRIRGNRDLIGAGGGVLFDPGSVDECAAAIDALLHSDCGQMGRNNREKIRNFSKETVNAIMEQIYRA